MSDTSPNPSTDWKEEDPGDMDWANATSEMKSLLDEVDRDIVGWLPDTQPKIYGKVVDITEGSSEYGEYPLIVLETPSGKLVGVHAFHHVLKQDIERRIKRDRLHIGDLMAVSYRGEGTAATGKNAPNMYRVAVKPAVHAES